MKSPDQKSLLRNWRSLSPAMKAALDEAADAPLRRQRHGWSSKGFGGHAPGTVEALHRRGLLHIDRLAGCAGVARITKLGGQVFGSVGEPLS